MVSSSSGTPFAENSQEIKLREYVSTAFEKKAKGDTTSYDVILKQLRSTADPLALKKWFYVLRQRVSLFSNSRRYYGSGKGKEKENVEEEISTSDYNELVSTLLQFDSWDNTDLSEDFISLVSDIVCSNGCYVIPCFQVLVKNFLPKKKSITTQNSEPYDASMMQTVSDNTHRAIERLVSLVPTSTATLFDVILELFPHKSFDLCTHKSFVSNLLRLSTYCYSLRDRILALIVEKIIQLDVEIKLEEVVEDEEDEQFALELNEGEGVETIRSYIEARQLQISDMADKLDTLMQIMFEYLNSIRQLTEEEDYEDVSTNQTLDEIFHLFLRLFDCAILNTHRSKYTQFLLFYLCQFNLNYTKSFLGYLLNKLFDANGYYSSSTLLRSTCAAYIGSFIARCSLVTLPIIKSCLFELARWAESYVLAHGDSQPDAQLHDIFYSVCQALFYMICFKNKLLLDNPANRAFIESLNLPAIVRSRLNPFKICLGSVVAEFSRLATAKKIMNCEEIIERNKRIVLPTKTVYGGYNQIESFFPFDPYLLKNSSAYVMNHYVSWKKIAEDFEEEEDEDSDYDEEEDETNSNSSYLSMSVTDENSTPTKFLACQRLKEHTEDLMSYSPAFNNEISLNDLISFGRH